MQKGTFLNILFPKCNDFSSMRYLRPIALCIVTYKIVSKVLANCLRQVLPSVIYETQSAFIKGRSITNNVLIVFELLHYIKRNKFATNSLGSTRFEHILLISSNNI